MFASSLSKLPNWKYLATTPSVAGAALRPHGARVLQALSEASESLPSGAAGVAFFDDNGGCSLPSPPSVVRSMILFHGAGGTDAATHEGLLSLINDRRFLDCSSAAAAVPQRAFLTPCLATALSFATVSSSPMSSETGRADFVDDSLCEVSGPDAPRSLSDIAVQLRTAAAAAQVASASTATAVTLRSVVALRVDFLSERALPKESEMGPVVFWDRADADTASGDRRSAIVQASSVTFAEDADHHQDGAACCYFYLGLDDSHPCFALLRTPSGPDEYHVSAAAIVHVVDDAHVGH